MNTDSNWTTGLFGCLEDFSSCWMTALAPCVTFGRTAEILDRGRTSCYSAGWQCFGLVNLGACCYYTCTYRTKLRALYSLPEEPGGDFCVHFWCTLCAISQEYRELKNRGVDPANGWDFNASKMPGAARTPPSVARGMNR